MAVAVPAADVVRVEDSRREGEERGVPASGKRVEEGGRGLRGNGFIIMRVAFRLSGNCWLCAT